MISNEDERWNAYFIDGTNVFKNNLGILDYDELHQAEKDITFEKLVELQINPIIGAFDSEHLRNIHEYLFSEIYPFAGKYRTVNMHKKTFFTRPEDISKELDIVMKEMHNEFLTCKTFSDYTIFLAEYFADIMKVHPFREGNGRAIREFIREFVDANMKDYTLKWSLANKENLDLGIEYAFFTKTYLIMEFERILVPRNRVEEDGFNR